MNNLDYDRYKDAFTESWIQHYPCKNPINLGANIKKDKDFLSATRKKVNDMFNKKAKLTRYGCLISVNPDDTINDSNFLAFRNVIQRKVLKKKWAQDALVYYEQRTTNLVAPWKGYHVHLLVLFVDKIRPYKVNAIKEITQSLTPNVSFKFNVDYKYLTTAQDYNQAHDYLSGYKADKTKRLKHKADLEMRKFFNIQ